MGEGKRGSRSTPISPVEVIAVVLLIALCYLLPHKMMFVTSAQASLRDEAEDDAPEHDQEQPGGASAVLELLSKPGFPMD